MTRPEMVEALAEHLKRIHFDGTGCGTTGANGCSNCYGPSPMSAHEIATALLDAIDAGQVPGLATSEQIARAIEDYADAEAARTEWDGAPGLLSNWVGGIRDAAHIARRKEADA